MCALRAHIKPFIFENIFSIIEKIVEKVVFSIKMFPKINDLSVPLRHTLVKSIYN